MLLKPAPKTKAALVPDGMYSAVLSNVTMFENVYGQRVGFEFTLTGAGVEGSKVMRSTSPTLSAKGKLAEVLSGLLGRDLTAAELASGVDASKLIGCECEVLVLQSKGKNGAMFSNVERIIKAGTELPTRIACASIGSQVSRQHR